MDAGLTFAHLSHLTTPLGLYEHARGTEPRPEHGYCVDDVARGLVVTAREANPTAEVSRLCAGYLDFVLAAQHDDGLLHNRRNLDGTWADEATTHDHWGRAVWALATAATRSPDRVVAVRAREGVERALRAWTLWPRSMAYAAIGCGLLLAHDPADAVAHHALEEARRVVPRARYDDAWPWPEARLTYANPVLPEAMLVIGHALDDDRLSAEAVRLLNWLVLEQTHDGHLSPVPVAGRAHGDARPGYDQQPIEIAALAEAASTALTLTGDTRWGRVLDDCVAWFDGRNDAGLPMCDRQTGGGYDGLEDGSVNHNQGAESTLAWLSTQQLSLTLATTAP